MLNYDVLLVHSGICWKLKGCVAELGAAGVHGEMRGVPLSIADEFPYRVLPP